MKVNKIFSCIPFGENALLVQIDLPDLSMANEQVINTVKTFERFGSEKIKEIVPANNSITLLYDREETELDDLLDEVSQLLEKPLSTGAGHKNTVELPVCYEEEYAPDLKAVCLQLNMSEDSLIKSHLETTYTVMMTGFMPGFFYLGQLPPSINVKRRVEPRTKVAAGSVGLADRQTGIYSVSCPGGWQIIGRSVNILDAIENGIISLRLGDQVKFFEVSKKELKEFTHK